MAITQHIQCCVPNTQRILCRPLPVCVLILQRREDLVKMVVIWVADVRPQDTVALRFIETKLQVLSVQVQVWFGACQTEEEVSVGKVGQFVAGGSGNCGRTGGRRRARWIQQYRTVNERGEACNTKGL